MKINYLHLSYEGENDDSIRFDAGAWQPNFPVTQKPQFSTPGQIINAGAFLFI